MSHSRKRTSLFGTLLTRCSSGLEKVVFWFDFPKSACFYLVLFTCNNLSAAQVDSNHAAALVNPNELTAWQQTQLALTAVVSKKSGLTVKSLLKQNIVDESFQDAVLRNYFEQPPLGVASDLIWHSVVVDEKKINSLMLAKKIPVWPDRRGELFVWVVEELENEELVNASPQSPVYYWLKTWFSEKGIPVTFYNYQEDDLLAFQPTDVRFLNPDLVDYVAENYDNSASLLVFVKHSGSGYSYRYGWSKPDQQMVIKNLQFVDLAFGLENLASEVQENMSSGQQVFADEFSQSTVSIKVNNIDSANQILSLTSYFDNHALIENYHISQLNNHQIDVVMQIKVLPDTFVKFVTAEKVLEHLPLDLGHTIIFSMTE
jgi:hypothetical protein